MLELWSEFVSLIPSFIHLVIYLLISWLHVCTDLPPTCGADNGGCSHRCVQTKIGARCTCKVGYQLKKDGKTCAGITSLLTKCTVFVVKFKLAIRPCFLSTFYFLNATQSQIGTANQKHETDKCSQLLKYLTDVIKTYHLMFHCIHQKFAIR